MPSPGSYNIPSTILRRGISFGISRECYSKVYQESNKTADEKIPGQGSYLFKIYIGNEGIKPSIKSRPKIFHLKDKSNIPGPGAYQFNYWKEGSVLNNSFAFKFSPPSSKRFLSQSSLFI